MEPLYPSCCSCPDLHIQRWGWLGSYYKGLSMDPETWSWSIPPYFPNEVHNPFSPTEFEWGHTVHHLVQQFSCCKTLGAFWSLVFGFSQRLLKVLHHSLAKFLRRMNLSKSREKLHQTIRRERIHNTSHIVDIKRQANLNSPLSPIQGCTFVWVRTFFSCAQNVNTCQYLMDSHHFPMKLGGWLEWFIKQ